MQFDFDTILDRRGMDALAVDSSPDSSVEPDPGLSRIPMWVADMSFPTAPAVVEAVRKRLEHPNFGYFQLPETYFDSIIRWHRLRNGVEDLKPEHIGYENGVLGGVCSVICAKTQPGDPILVHAPTYVGFTGTLNRIGRTIVSSNLTRDADGIWRMDFADMEQKIREQGIKVVLFCSPHNPCGRVWERWEIERLVQLCETYDCTIISDEIWSDIIMPGNQHIPTQSVNETARRRTVALYATTKTFSLAGFVGSYHVIYDPELRAAVRRQGDFGGYNHCNVLSMHALTGAYSDAGMAWVDELCQVLDRNLRYVRTFMESNFPGVTMMQPQGTYMLWANIGSWCRAYGLEPAEVIRRGIRAGVMWSAGAGFGCAESIRINAALPFALVEEAMQRLKERVFIPQ